MKLADTVKIIIESRICPVHDINPLVEITGNELEIVCCCTEFHDECMQEANGLFMKNSVFPFLVMA